MLKRGDSSHPMWNALEGADREPSSVDDQFKRKARSQGWRVTRSGWKESQHLDSTGRGLGDQQTLHHPSQEERRVHVPEWVSVGGWRVCLGAWLAPDTLDLQAGWPLSVPSTHSILPGSNQLGQNGWDRPITLIHHLCHRLPLYLSLDSF